MIVLVIDNKLTKEQIQRIAIDYNLNLSYKTKDKIVIDRIKQFLNKENVNKTKYINKENEFVLKVERNVSLII